MPTVGAFIFFGRNGSCSWFGVLASRLKSYSNHDSEVITSLTSIRVSFRVRMCLSHDFSGVREG